MKIKKLIAGVLACTMLSGFSVSATDQTIDYDSTVDENSSSYSDVSVSAERAELYTVTLPKAVTLEVHGDDAVFDYTVSVTGEISSGHYVRVIPLSNAKIIDENELYVYDLGVTQEKRRWTPDQLDGTVTADGRYTAENIEPGKYDGKVRYYITCDDGGIWSPATCTEPARCQGYDDNDNGVLDTEDTNGNGVLDTTEDINGNGILDVSEDLNSDGILDDGEDTNGNGVLDTVNEDVNANGVLDTLDEDLDSDGVLDTEYLDTVIYKGNSLGHKFEDLANAFPAKCERCGEMIYAISTPEQFNAFRESVNSAASMTYAGATVCLTADIDMAGYEWAYGIGDKDSYFSGTFDGCGHSIKNLTIKSTAHNNKAYALFTDTTGAQCVLKNFVLDNAYFDFNHPSTNSSSITYAFILGKGNWSSNIITNVHVRNSTAVVLHNHDIHFGGICGDMYLGEISKCSVTNTTVTMDSGDTVELGGILGVASCYTASVGKKQPDICNCFSALKPIILQSDYYTMAPFYVPTTNSGGSYSDAINCVYNNDIIYTFAYTYRGGGGHYDAEYQNVLAATDAECKTQAVIDVLNTGLDTPHWKLDLEGINDGYPIPIK